MDMETLLKGIGDKRNFIDLVENFILFDDSTEETRKVLARNHQFLGVNRAVESVREREARGRRLGVFWHTQGAGKSYSMVMFTRKVQPQARRELHLPGPDGPQRSRPPDLQDLRRLRGGGPMTATRVGPPTGGTWAGWSPSTSPMCSRSSRSSTEMWIRTGPIRSVATSSSSPTRRIVRSTASWLSTCAMPCRTRASSDSPARRSSRTTRSPGRSSASMSRPTTSSARWRTAPPCLSTTMPAARSWGWRSET